MYPNTKDLTILLIHPDLIYDQDLFNFTRGRFVNNEKQEMSQRHMHFKVNELAHRAAEVFGAKTCINIVIMEEVPGVQLEQI